jgi:hypothetical protein
MNFNLSKLRAIRAMMEYFKLEMAIFHAFEGTESREYCLVKIPFTMQFFLPSTSTLNGGQLPWKISFMY